MFQDVPEENIDKVCATKEATAPRLILFYGNGKLMEAAIVGDGQRIFCKTNSVLVAVLYVVIIYYITDLNFPRQYSQLLGILQQYVICETFDGPVSGKFMKMNHQIDAAFSGQL